MSSSLRAVHLSALLTGIVLYPSASGRFTGGAGGLALAYGALGFALALGVTCLLTGARKVVYGRRNLKLVRVVIVLYVIFWVGAILVRALG